MTICIDWFDLDVTTGVWFFYEARLRIRAIRSRAHLLLARCRYTEPGSELHMKLYGIGHSTQYSKREISDNYKEMQHRNGSYKIKM